jgi:hypothetical protein
MKSLRTFARNTGIKDKVVESFMILTARLRCLPDYIIIGVQRGGTTSLYNYLIQHPAILSSYRKEVHYFTKNYGKGLSWYLSNFPTEFVRRRLAKQLGERVVTGEATPYYLFHPLAPIRIKQLVPDARFILLLRDPVERAYSHFDLSRRRNNEPLERFEDALDAEPERLKGEREKLLADETYFSHSHQHHSYLTRGLYADQLEYWFQFFPREQILILRSEDMYEQTAEVFKQTCHHIGVREIVLPEFRVFGKPKKVSPLSPETHERLREFFRPHNERLYQVIGRDMGWEKEE